MMALCCDGGCIADLQQSFCGKKKRAEASAWCSRRVWCTSLQDELERDKWLSQLNGHLKQGKVGEAEELMRKMQEVGLRPDLLSYNSMITVNGKSDRFAAALAWFSRLEADKWLQPDGVTYRSMIGACGRAGELEEALEFYHRMEACGFRPSSQNFNTLISLHRKAEKGAKWEEQILSLLVDMREMGCCPDSSTVDVLVKVYERWGMLENLSAAISLLEAAGWSPTCRCHNILLKAYIRCGLVDQALSVFHILCSQIYRLEEPLCHSLICLCRTSGRYAEAMQVYSEMRHSGVEPSWFTACTVIDICGRFNEASAVERGEALFEEMRSSALGRESTDAGAYTVTINMFLKAGLVQKATEVSSLVTEHDGLVPDSALFLAMLRAYSRNGMPGKAVQVYKRMLEVRLTWTASMFNGVIHCCGRALPLEEIIKVFLAMVYAKVPLSNVTCNLMMDIFAKAGLMDKAENLFKLAQEQCVLDAISFNTMIDAYGKYKEFNKMERALLDMQNSGFKDHIEAYNSMIDAYGKSGQLSRMENILERMRRADCHPDLSTYNTLINVYGREGLIVEVQKVRKSMDEANIKPDNYTFNTLIFAYGNAEMPNEAMGAFKEMQDLNLVPDEVTYNCLIAAFEKSNNHLEAARWSLWMTQLGMKQNFVASDIP